MYFSKFHSDIIYPSVPTFPTQPLTLYAFLKFRLLIRCLGGWLAVWLPGLLLCYIVRNVSGSFVISGVDTSSSLYHLDDGWLDN